MKDEKDLQGQDTDALELQIDKMIDELFVGKEEPGLADRQGVTADVGTAGGEASFGPVAGGIDLETAKTEPAAVSAGLQELQAGMSGESGMSPVAYADTAGPLSDKAERKIQWDIGVPGAIITDRGTEKESAVASLGNTDKEARVALAKTAQWEGPGADLEFAAVTGLGDEQGPEAGGLDTVPQRLYNSLKENILSLEWEISPQNIERFLEAISPVQEHLVDNPSALKSVSMMVSVLNYIRRIGRSALPLSIQVLQNGVDFLGMVLLPEEHVDAEKRKEFLATFVDHYRVLKFQIEQQRDKTQRPKATAVTARLAISPEIAEYIKGVVDDAVSSLVETTVEAEIRKLKQEIVDMLAHGGGSETAPGAAGIPQETAAEEVLTVTLGDRHFDIPKALVANVYSPSPRKLTKVLETRRFRISELISLFGSVTKGLLGPLALVPVNDLKNLSFELVDVEKAFNVSGYLQPRQLVLISDGKKGYGLLVDATIWRTAEIPKGLMERMVTGAVTDNDVIQAPPEDYPFLNVAKML